MSKHFPPDDEDLIFFRKAMQDVKRSKRIPVLKKTSKKFSHAKQLIKSASEKKEVEHKFTTPLPLLSDPMTQIIAAEEKLFFRRQGPQLKVIKNLMQGEIPRSACLDLHGMSVEQARLAVVEFLVASQTAGFRCVQIVHGKGQLSQAGPKLKNHVSYWLPQIQWVLAFSSAQPRDGGRGAVYILLAKSLP